MVTFICQEKVTCRRGGARRDPTTIHPHSPILICSQLPSFLECLNKALCSTRKGRERERLAQGSHPVGIWTWISPVPSQALHSSGRQPQDNNMSNICAEILFFPSRNGLLSVRQPNKQAQGFAVSCFRANGGSEARVHQNPQSKRQPLLGSEQDTSSHPLMCCCHLRNLTLPFEPVSVSLEDLQGF